jgi:hypothetical protein
MLSPYATFFLHPSASELPFTSRKTSHRPALLCTAPLVYDHQKMYYRKKASTQEAKAAGQQDTAKNHPFSALTHARGVGEFVPLIKARSIYKRC